jgi:NAD(P)-dependent dehydrogenase (short-subunit alcohol dehydrogenase family)
MAVNATGLMLMHRAFGTGMAEQGRGSIVNIGSIQGMIGPSYELYVGTQMGDMPPDYFFHKGGMLNLTRFYAALYGPRQVRVNCVSPGGFFNNQPEPFLSRYSEHTMLGRMADDTDLGGSIIFLLSDASRYVTGVNLPVDGGYTAK